MKTVKLSDLTLRNLAQNHASFKEKIEIARALDRLRVDVMELPAIRDAKADALTNKTVASVVTGAAISALCGLSERSIEEAWESVRAARFPELHLMFPASAIQMEYTCHKKAPAMTEMIAALTAKARYYCDSVEVSFQDATRAEKAFLYQATAAAVDAGANTVTFCDTAGIMTPEECAAFLNDLQENVPTLAKAELGVELSDEIHMAVACAAAAVEAGAVRVKTSVTPMGVPLVEDFEKYIRLRGDARGIRVNLRGTELNRTAAQLQFLIQTRRGDGSPFDNGVAPETGAVSLSAGDDIGEVTRAVKQLGYEMSEEDYAKVYEAFRRIAAQKHFVGSRELEAIIATTAFQAPSTYHITRYTVTSGNTIGAMADLLLERDGESLQGVSAGDGPVDAAFLAIERIIGHHYELDDFQIQTVTEGREAMGSALVKLRAHGKLYSGTGISTDIIGASIRAYISALNKIVYEEA